MIFLSLDRSSNYTKDKERTFSTELASNLGWLTPAIFFPDRIADRLILKQILKQILRFFLTNNIFKVSDEMYFFRLLICYI